MISKIYSYDKPLFKVGERKGKSKSQIEKMNKQRVKFKPLKGTQEKLSHFINCNQGYFNKGKYKGKLLEKVPVNYLIWVLNNVSDLNKTEIKLLSRNIKNKRNYLLNRTSS